MVDAQVRGFSGGFGDPPRGMRGARRPGNAMPELSWIPLIPSLIAVSLFVATLRLDRRLGR
jgi:hypothetical protein